MKIVLDTNAYTALMKGEERITAVLEFSEEVFVPAVVLGELYGGFHLGKYRDKNIRTLELFLSKPGISCLDSTKAIAERYGMLIKFLKEQGTPIPTNDIWISASVLETGFKLATRDRYFEYVPGIYILPF
jgi:tRNA(fMet)-specific endonuclease VapC